MVLFVRKELIIINTYMDLLNPNCCINKMYPIPEPYIKYARYCRVLADLSKAYYYDENKVFLYESKKIDLIES